MDSNVVGSLSLEIGMDTNTVTTQLGKVKSIAGETGISIGKSFATAFQLKPLETFGTKCTAVFAQAKTEGSTFASGLSEKMTTWLMGFQMKLEEVKQYFSTTFMEGISTSFGGMCENLRMGWSGAWKGILSFFTGTANKIVSGLNTVIKGMNAIKVDIPEWLGGGSFGFNVPLIPNVPYLAKGGIVSGPTLAMVGERGKEAVLPLERNTEWMTGFANAVADAVTAGMAVQLAQNGSGSNSQGRGSGSTIVLEIDGKALAEATIQDFSHVAQRNGITLQGK